jgi:hypothetical protein
MIFHGPSKAFVKSDLAKTNAKQRRLNTSKTSIRLEHPGGKRENFKIPQKPSLNFFLRLKTPGPLPERPRPPLVRPGRIGPEAAEPEPRRLSPRLPRILSRAFSRGFFSGSRKKPGSRGRAPPTPGFRTNSRPPGPSGLGGRKGVKAKRWGKREAD